MAWNRENDAAVAKYQKETFDKIFNNEIERDNGMKAFYVNPTTYNSKPLAPGFGEQDKPDKPKVAKDGKDDKADDSSNI